MFLNKKVIVIGERDGVAAPAIAACVEAAGAKVVLLSTECFVWTSAGAMDPHTQQSILDAVKYYGRENLIVVLGSPSPEAAAMAAETVTTGDPTFAGPLAEIQLGLPVYHILEDQVRQALDPHLYDEQVGLMAEVLDADAIAAAVKEARTG